MGGSRGQGSDSEERMSIGECVSVQVCGPVGLPDIHDCGVTHYFILLWLSFFSFISLPFGNKLVNNVFISCYNEEEMSLYIEEFRRLVFVVFVFYWQ